MPPPTKSQFAEIIEEGRHHVVFRNKILEEILGTESIVLYENVHNTFHSGTGEELEKVISFVENENSKPSKFALTPQVEDMLTAKAQQLVLDVTLNCTNRCGYCSETQGGLYEDSRVHADVYMSPEIIEKSIVGFSKIAVKPNRAYLEIIKGLRKAGEFTNKASQISSWFFRAANYLEINYGLGPAISFFGGEPMLNFEGIKYAVEQAEKYLVNPRFNLTSNMMVMTEEMMDYLIDKNFAITISLDGPKDIHDAFRKTAADSGTWDVVMKNVTKLIERMPNPKGRILFNAVLSDPSRIDEVRGFYEQNFPEYIVTSGLLDPMSALRSPDTYSKDKIQIYKEKYFRMAVEFVKSVIDGDYHQSMFLYTQFAKPASISTGSLADHMQRDELPPFGSCAPGIRRVFAEYDGKLSQCEKAPGLINLGDADTGFDYGLSRQAMEEMVEIRNTVCGDCYLDRTCQPCEVHAGETYLSADVLQSSCNGFLKARALKDLSLASALQYFSDSSPKVNDFFKEMRIK